jgi:hypothetical protein
LFIRRGKPDHDLGVTVFETFMVAAILVTAGVAASFSVWLLRLDKPVEDSAVAGIETLLVLAVVMLVLLVSVAKFSSLRGGALEHLHALVVTLFMALAVGVGTAFIASQPEYIVPTGGLILVIGACIAWFFLKLERRSIAGRHRALRQQLISLSSGGYERTEKCVLLTLPEPWRGIDHLLLDAWSKKERVYLDLAGCRRLREEVHGRWSDFENGKARMPDGFPVLVEVQLKLRWRVWPPRYRLMVGIHREGEALPTRHAREADDHGLFDLTNVGLI